MKQQRILAAPGPVTALLIAAAVITIASVGPAAASASTIAGTSGDFNYSVSDGVHASIDGYRGSSTTVVIPTTLDGYPVTAIGVRAFQDMSLTSVSIPEGIVVIDALSFNRTHLTAVTLPSTLTTIGTEAFSENNLTSITIPAAVTTIDSYAFYSQSTLRSARFLGNAPAMTSTVFFAVASDFTVTVVSGKTGYGTGSTWLGFPTVIAAAETTAAPGAAKLAATGLEATPLFGIGMIALVFGGTLVSLRLARRKRA